MKKYKNYFDNIIGKYIIYHFLYRRDPLFPRDVLFASNAHPSYRSLGVFTKDCARLLHIITFNTLAEAKVFYATIRKDWRETQAIGKVTNKGIRFAFKEKFAECS